MVKAIRREKKPLLQKQKLFYLVVVVVVEVEVVQAYQHFIVRKVVRDK